MDNLKPVLLRHLRDVELEIDSRFPLVPADVDQDSVLMWGVRGTLTVFPDTDDDAGVGLAWALADGTSLSAPTVAADDSIEICLFRASGFTVDTYRVANLADSLDAMSEEAERFVALIDPDTGDLVDEVDGFVADRGNLVVIERAELAPAWRGAGGVGRLLTAAAIRWLSLEAKAVAVQPFPLDLAGDPTIRPVDHPRFEEELASVRRTWATLGFTPLGHGDVWVLDPHAEALEDAEETLRATLLAE